MSAAVASPKMLGDLLDVMQPIQATLVDRSCAIGRLADDSRACEPGTAFFARRGTVEGGSSYIQDALEKGAVVIVSDTALAPSIPHVVVASVEEALRAAADRWYGEPQTRMLLIAATGTKGKTTVAHLVVAGLRACGTKTAIIGTTGHDLGGDTVVAASNTTPGILRLRALLAEALANGCEAAVLEVSSHALDQGRTDGLDFAVAIFTNLTSDHLDYHKTKDAYRDAKLCLFRGLRPDAHAILNRDDPSFDAFADASRSAITSFGQDRRADVRATDLHLSATRSTFTVSGLGARSRTCSSALVGRHNVSNVLAALTTVSVLGFDMDRATAGILALSLVRGRLERVALEGVRSDVHVFVDYAHTEDALRQVLEFLRGVGAHPLTVVVGCGGDRDRTKRPRMARVAAEIAHAVVFTSDNPRSEDPQSILDDMVSGIDHLSDRLGGRVVTILSRREAIERAILDAPHGSTVLVAGKGHETYQVIGNMRLPFCDVTEVRRVLALRAGLQNGDEDVRGGPKKRRDGDPPRDSEV